MTRPRDTNHDDGTSFAALLGDILTRLTTLMRREFDLARSEVASNLHRAAIGIGMVVIAVVLLLTALNTLSGTAIAAMVAAGMEPIWASLLFSAILLLCAAILAAIGINRMKASSIAPDRTATNLRQDARTIREALND